MVVGIKTITEIPKKMAASNLRYLVIGLFTLAMLIVPLGAGPYPVTIMVDVGLYSIVTMGLILLMGFAGQISLGHAIFFGSGAYASAILSTQYNISPWLAILAAAVFSGGIAAFIGRFMFRLHGLILAAVTLALNLVFYFTVTSFIGLTGGAMGMINIPPLSLGGFTSKSLHFNYYLVWITAILFLVFSLNLASSRAGRALRALNAHDGGSEDGAQVLGINIMKYKLWAFVLSAIYASIAGSIFAHYTRVLEPGTFMLQFSAMVVLMAIIGGRSSPWGAFLGASLIVGLRHILREFIPILVGGPTGAYELIAYGSILMVALLFLPRGLISLVQKVAPKKRPIANES